MNRPHRDQAARDAIDDLGLIDDDTAALSVYCPLCLARPGDPCEDVSLGRITARQTPHDIRIRAADEVARG